MAFHPFHWFRKNKKIIFAILTIVCMVVFVVSFGVGDPFSRMGRDRRPAGHYVTTLYGRKVYEGDLETLAVQRAVVNDLMVGGPEVRDQILQGGLLIRALGQPRANFRAPAQDSGRPGRTVERDLQPPAAGAAPGPADRSGDPLQRGSHRPRAALATALGTVEKSDALRAIDQLSTILEIETYLTNPNRKPNELYFGGTLLDRGPA